MNDVNAHPKRRPRLLLGAACTVAIAVSSVAVATFAHANVSQQPAHAGTTGFHGVNWSDQRDNFVDGVLYVSGLNSADTYASAATVGDRVVSSCTPSPAGGPDANNVRLRNRATGLYLDGTGRTANGASIGQYSDSTSANQRWKIVAAS